MLLEVNIKFEDKLSGEQSTMPALINLNCIGHIYENAPGETAITNFSGDDVFILEFPFKTLKDMILHPELYKTQRN